MVSLSRFITLSLILAGGCSEVGQNTATDAPADPNTPTTNDDVAFSPDGGLGEDATGGNAVSPSASGGGGTDAASATGGASTNSGASDSGGSPSGGAGPVTTLPPPFILGADISGTQETTAGFVDTDGVTKPLLELLGNHGFNYVRLRTFVDPDAPYGYSSTANGCAGKPEPFGDQAHVIAYGAQAKAAGMGLLLDFHYSDVWADPGNQIIPAAWRNATSIQDLASRVRAYTESFIKAAILGGARPDMVQVGNEITPGLMMHIPDGDTDCWGNNPAPAALGGSTSNWDALAVLLKAGIEGVRAADPSIKVMLHIENTDNLNGVRWWVESAQTRGVEFDVLGLSCYTAFQGEPSVWQNTFETMAEEHPELEFVIAEYNPERTAANRLIAALPNGRGLGTFFWEPTVGGEWGAAMFTWQGNNLVARADDFAEFDALRLELGL